jgi:putative transposase
MRDFKKFTSHEIRNHFLAKNELEIVESIRYVYRKQKFKIWKDRFDDLYLFKGKTLLQKLKYIHDNPVRKELCHSPAHYKYSSAAFYYNGEIPLLPILHCSEMI